MLLDDVFEFKLVWKSKNPQNVSAVKSAGRVEWFPRGLLAADDGAGPATCHQTPLCHDPQSAAALGISEGGPNRPQPRNHQPEHFRSVWKV